MTTSDSPARPDRRRTIAGTALVVVLVAILAVIVTVRSNGEKVINADGDTLVLVDKARDDGMQALDGGVLADVGGCLGWTAAKGSTDGATVVVWPHGTNVDTTDPLRFKIDGKTYAIGDTIEIGGGEGGPLRTTSYFYDRVPAACRTAKVWFATAS